MSQNTAGLRRRPSYLLLRMGCLGALSFFFMACLGLTALYAGSMFVSSPAVFALATFLATLTAVPYGLVLLWFDRNEHEPLTLVTTAFLWGAVVATLFSLIANTTFGLLVGQVVRDYGLANQLTASIMAPFAEELTKGSALLLLFLLFRRDFDNVLDGILYGALIGLGFAWYENILYYCAASKGGPDDMLKLSFMRGLLNGVMSHSAYTGLTGLGFGLVRVLRKGLLRWALVPFFWGLAMFAHATWNTLVGVVVQTTGARSEAELYLVSMPVAIGMLELPFAILLLFVVLFVWGHENRVIRRYLQSERPDVIRPTELQRLVPARRRAWDGLRRFFSAGPLRWWRHRALETDLIRLAFEKWHHEREIGEKWTVDQDHEIALLRTRILRRRRQLGLNPE